MDAGCCLRKISSFKITDVEENVLPRNIICSNIVLYNVKEETQQPTEEMSAGYGPLDLIITRVSVYYGYRNISRAKLFIFSHFNNFI